MFSSFPPRGILSLVGLSALLVWPLHSAWAIAPPQHLQQRGDVELGPGSPSMRHSAAGQWQRRAPTSAASSAYAALQTELGGRALTRFDVDTGVLDTVVPDGLSVPQATHSPAAAEAFARAFLQRHVALLAPGSSASDFQLVSNVMTGNVRSVGFVQTHGGRAVVGGQLSFRFQADRLVAVRSQALPHVQPAPRSADANASTVRSRARRWVADDFGGAQLSRTRAQGAIDGPQIFPIVSPGGAIDYREVLSLEVELDDPHGRWQVFVDAETGEPVARRSLTHFAEVRFDVFQRSPVLGGRTTLPASFLSVDVDGTDALADVGGVLDLAAPSNVSFGASGTRARVFNGAGPDFTQASPLGPADLLVVNQQDDVLVDAQLNAYAHTQVVKQRVLSIDPSFEVPLSQTVVTVNIDDVCNAFADGDTLNFFSSGGGCENTALLADVVYHEYGHVAHVLGLVPGVGIFSGSLSEGASDYLSATIVNDASVGIGFYQGSDEPLRELDPPGVEWHWPEDQGEVHYEGQIIGGTLWDLRTLLIEKHGAAEGIRRTDEIWLQSIRRAVDLPSMYLEALVTNDDDGNLQNGTPDICEIDEAFGKHGLYQPPGTVDVSVSELPDGDLQVRVEYDQQPFSCMNSQPSAVMNWRQRGEVGVAPGSTTTTTMAPAGTNAFEAIIADPAENAVVQYRVELDQGNGVTSDYPRNDVDPWYETFVGETTIIWCSTFEDGGEGWASSGEWTTGSPSGGSGDPDSAFEGSRVAGTDLSADGAYGPFIFSELTSPLIDASAFENVRLQYRRWLTVEDGYFDRAAITANGEAAWENFTSVEDFAAHRHHRDREWRFHDVDLTSYLDDDGAVEIGFQLNADAGLHFGGWNVDALCIVGAGEGPGPGPGPGTGGDGALCGDGIVGMFEQCDDGNLQNGDGCSSGCLLEDEEPEGTDTGDTGGEIDWQPGGRGCGCSSQGDGANTGGPAGGLIGLMLLGLVGFRRRERA